MLKNRYAYPAIFSYDDDGISIEFPDLPGCCPCADKDDTDMAIRNAREALGLHMWGIEDDNDLKLELCILKRIRFLYLSKYLCRPSENVQTADLSKKQFHFPHGLQPRQMRTALIVQNCFSRL